MSYLKYEDGSEVKHGELTLAISALNSRLHRQGFQKQFQEAWKALVDGSSGKIKPQEAKIQVAKSLFRPGSMNDVDPQEWPLWGVRCEQPTSIIRNRERKRALAEGETAPASPEMAVLRGQEEEVKQIRTLALLVRLTCTVCAP